MSENIEIQNNLPKDWGKVKLGEVATFQTGKREKGGAKTSGGVPSIGGEHITEDGKINFYDSPKYISPAFFQNMKKGKVNIGDVLLVKDGAKTGKSAIVRKGISKHMAVNEHVFVIRSKNQSLILTEFIGFWFHSNQAWKQIKRAYHGLIGGINRKQLSNFILPLPSFPEQKAIAFVLRSVQEAKEATEKVISSLKELKKSLMKHFFTYGPVPINQKSQVKLKETEVGQIPEHWEVVKLKEVTKFMKAGGTPKRSETKFWRGNIPFVLVRDLTSCGIYLNKTEETITEEGLNNSSAWLVPPRSLLLSMYATIGETAVNTIPVATNQAILALIPNDTFHVEFGAYLLKFHSKRLAKYNVQSTQKNINKGIVKNFPIPLPPIEEQEKMAEILKAVDEKIEAEEKRKEALESLFKSLLNNLMTAKIRLPEEFIKKFEEESNELRK